MLHKVQRQAARSESVSRCDGENSDQMISNETGARKHFPMKTKKRSGARDCNVLLCYANAVFAAMKRSGISRYCNGYHRCCWESSLAAHYIHTLRHTRHQLSGTSMVVSASRPCHTLHCRHACAQTLADSSLRHGVGTCLPKLQ